MGAALGEPLTRVLLFSDIDDTLFPGRYPLAGRDQRGSSSAVDNYYPCLREFFRAVFDKKSGKLFLCTGRPRLIFDGDAFAVRLKSEGVIPESCEVQILYGSVASTPAALLGALAQVLSDLRGVQRDPVISPGAYGGVAERKVEAVRSAVASEFARVVPGQRFLTLFVGDDGQGDVTAAQMLLALGAIDTAFIHVTRHYRPEYRTATKESGGRLRFFCDYSSVLRDVRGHLAWGGQGARSPVV